MKGGSNVSTFCPLDGILLIDCPHVSCECGEVRGVCGGCFKCFAKCHDDYSECADWLIGVEVRGAVFEVVEEEEDAN